MKLFCCFWNLPDVQSEWGKKMSKLFHEDLGPVNCFPQVLLFWTCYSAPHPLMRGAHFLFCDLHLFVTVMRL